MNYGKIFFAVFIAALLLGCAGSQQPATTTPPAAPPAPGNTAVPNVPSSEGLPTVPAGTPQANNTAPSTASPPSPNGGAQPAASGVSFDSITANAANLQYKADYKTTSTSSDGQATVFESSVVVKGKNTRTDMTVGGSKTSTYLLDKVAYVCTFAAQTTCLSISMQQPGVAAQAESDPSKYTITPKLPRTIAGVLASCFAISGPSIAGEYESCYSAEGVPLYMALSDGSFVEEATSVQIGNIADGEFTLPAQPIDVNAYANSYGNAGGYGG
jgi:hypothetical protein